MVSMWDNSRGAEFDFRLWSRNVHVVWNEALSASCCGPLNPNLTRLVLSAANVPLNVPPVMYIEQTYILSERIYKITTNNITFQAAPDSPILSMLK